MTIEALQEPETRLSNNPLVRQSRAERMLAILLSPDQSLHHVEVRGLLDLRREAWGRRVIFCAMSGSPTTARAFQVSMSQASSFEFGTPTSELGGELRWRCDHRCGFHRGYCAACEMNELYQGEAHMAARRVHRAALRRAHWAWLAWMWAQLLEY